MYKCECVCVCVCVTCMYVSAYVGDGNGRDYSMLYFRERR